MADRLTQLQDCLDDLLMQMFATLNYIQSHHPYGDIPGQPSQAPQSTSCIDEGGPNAAQQLNGNSVSQRDRPNHSVDGPTIRSESLSPSPDTPDVFQSALRELAQDLVVQEQKAELLINSLPGIGNSERDQMVRTQELELELKQAGMLRAQAEAEKTAMLHNLDRLIRGVRRVR